MIPIITANELKNLIDKKNKILIIDVRDTLEYKKDHIPGAVHLLIAEMKDKAHKIIPRGIPVVVYSEDLNCPASGIAAHRLFEMGYKDVYDYEGSYDNWKESGYPLEQN